MKKGTRKCKVCRVIADVSSSDVKKKLIYKKGELYEVSDSRSEQVEEPSSFFVR